MHNINLSSFSFHLDKSMIAHQMSTRVHKSNLPSIEFTEKSASPELNVDARINEMIINVCIIKPKI